MFCPNCGASVSATKFCENCGNPLPDAQNTTPIEQPTEPMSDYAFAGVQPTDEMPQVTEPVSSYVAEVPGDSAWQAQPQQAYQTGQTTQMPPQPDTGSYMPYVDGPQPPYRQSVPYNPPTGGTAPNAAFVLVIVGLVLSLLFVTFIPGLVCSIIGLVLNASYNKKGMNNPRKTPTLVIGIIGIVIAILCIVFTVFIGIITAQVIDEAEQQGIDLSSNNIEVTTDSNGKPKITVTDSDSSASASDDSSAKSSDASSASSASASSAAATGAIANGSYSDSKYHDSMWNPTMYAITELTGAELTQLLKEYNYTWDNDLDAWVFDDESMFMVSGLTGELSKSQIEKLPKGAAGELVVIGMYTPGYKTPSSAFKDLTKDVVVEDTYDYGELYMGVIRNSASDRYLAVVADDEDGQMILLFAENAISKGLFEDLIGIDAGSSINDVWEFLTGKSIGSRQGRLNA